MKDKVGIKDLMQLTPETLAAQQEKALVGFATGLLTIISNHLKKGEYDQIGKYLTESPSGDGYGCDNYYIDFSESGAGEDIGAIVSHLILLRDIQKVKAGKK